MILGGNVVQADAVRTAHEQGYYVICADPHEDAPGHSYADESCMVDLTDRDAVLREAQRLDIDGIVPYASDSLATVAAYVAETMSLPGNSFRVVEMMTRKTLFRQFMEELGIPTPHACGCKTVDEAVTFFTTLGKTAIMKPVDASGSKGVYRVENEDDIRRHWSETLSYSAVGEVIVEEFIDSALHQQDGDIFVVDGEIVLWGMCDQYKDVAVAPYAPAMLSLPSAVGDDIEAKARDMVQKILTAIGFKMGACNVEYLVGSDGQVYILEIGPRNGGNQIPYVVKESMGVDITAMTLRQAVGDDIDISRVGKKRYAMSMVLHSCKEGHFHGLTLSEEAQRHLCKKVMFVENGDCVHAFNNGKDALGVMVFSFEDREQLDRALLCSGYVSVDVSD